MKKQTLTVTRKIGGETDGAGKIGPASSIDTFEIRSTVQPVTGDKLQRVTGLEGVDTAYRLFPKKEIRTAKPGSGTDPATPADTVSIHGEEMQVQWVKNWGNKVKPHYEAYVYA